MLHRIDMLSKLDKEITKTCEIVDTSQAERDKMKAAQGTVQDLKDQIEDMEQVQAAHDLHKGQ